VAENTPRIHTLWREKMQNWEIKDETYGYLPGLVHVNGYCPTYCVWDAALLEHVIHLNWRRCGSGGEVSVINISVSGDGNVRVERAEAGIGSTKRRFSE
jgi:hypothetical protein